MTWDWNGSILHWNFHLVKHGILESELGSGTSGWQDRQGPAGSFIFKVNMFLAKLDSGAKLIV